MYLKIDEPQKYSAALYLRLSKEDDKNKGSEADSESIVNQRALLEKFAKDADLKYKVYTDDGWSGGNFDRPAFEEMITDIEAKRINMVITKDMSRLGRDYIDTGHYMERYFPENDVRYISLLDGIDTGIDSTNNDISPFRALLNDMYAKDISKKILAVKHAKQAKGQFVGGKAYFGYAKHPTEKNKIVIDEVAAEIVRQIFELALDGKSCREIAIILNAKNIPTPATYANIKLTRKGPYSGLWSSERISAMLTNEVYIGNMVQGRTRKLSYKSKKSIKLPREKWIVVEGTHEPLIDRETFDKVGLLIKSRDNTRQRTLDYLLKGLVYCHECGYPLGVVKRKLAGNRDVMYLLCRTYQRFTQYDACTCHCVRLEAVTNIILEKVKNICQRYSGLLDLGELTDEANGRMLAEKKRQKNSSANIKANLEAIKSKIDRVYNDRLSEKLAEEDFQRIYKKLKDEQTALQNKLQNLDGSENDGLLDNQKTKELVQRFLAAEECNRELIVSMIEKIELTKDKELLIHFRFKELELPEYAQEPLQLPA